ncbi:hypothetical protein EsH8_VII_000420 [Colletotrichum jinshuiense]
MPSCTNCARSGHLCVRANLANNPDAVSHITKLEARLRSLEDSLRRVAPDELNKAPILEARITTEPCIMVTTTPEAGNSLDTAIEPTQTWLQQEIDGISAGQSARHEGFDEQEQAADMESLPGVNNFSNPNGSDANQGDAGLVKHHIPSNPSTASTNPTDVAFLSPASTEIGPSEPLAHEVGLLSLANSKESKYLGPSSGVPFARLIFSAIPQTQGLSVSWTAPEGGTVAQSSSPTHQPFPPHWKSEVDLQHFADAYFQTIHPIYPFLDEDTVSDHLECLYTTQKAGSLQMPSLAEVEASLSPFHSVQTFLVLALGARILESRLSTEFSSERYLATAMQRVSTLALHDSIEGLQIMLLLALTSFYFPDGPNAWFLVMNIIASCLDLGFQRRVVDTHRTSPLTRQPNTPNRINLRRGIFWSAYSLERTISVVLGRPLTLRDEAIDIEFPGHVNLSTDQMGAGTVGPSAPTPEDDHPTHQSTKRARIVVDPYAAAQYSIKFDQITAEIKLMLHRVVNLPDRFPWPSDLDTWQTDTRKRCDSLLEGLRAEFRRGFRRSTSDGVVHNLELKYHHCIMLLYRSSPAITRPSLDSWDICYESAVATILINSELHRFSKLSNTWLTAHTVFVSGITFLYCVWIVPKIKQNMTLDAFNSNASACTSLLKHLAKTWSVAADAVVKFERLVQLTTMAWKTADCQASAEIVAGHSLLSMAQAQERSSAGVKEGNNSGDTPVLSAEGGVYAASGVEEGVMGSNGEFEPDSFFNELGDMSSWFDLNWLLDSGAGLGTSDGHAPMMF